jgi:hypothetical protein
MKTPHQLSHEATEHFRAIYKEEFGVTLSDDESRKWPHALLRFFGVLQNGR